MLGGKRVERVFAGAIGVLLLVLAFAREVVGFVADVFQVLETITGENAGVSLGSAAFRVILLVAGLLLIWQSTRRSASEKEEDERLGDFKAVFEMKVMPAFEEGVRAIGNEVRSLPQTDAHLFWAVVTEHHAQKLGSYRVHLRRREPFEPHTFESSMLGAWAVLYEMSLIYRSVIANRVHESHAVGAWFERVVAMEKDLRVRFRDDRVNHTKTLAGNSVAHVLHLRL